MAKIPRHTGAKGGAGARKSLAGKRHRSRAAPGAAAAREVEAPGSAGLRPVPPPRARLGEAEHQGAVGERVAGGAAADRDDETSWETPAEEDLRLRAEAASSELRRRAEELREEARNAPPRLPDEPPAWRDAPRNLPGGRSLAAEFAIATVRLAGTLATAPFRLAWAILRSRREE
jgi:hypothetical protein